VEQPLATVVIVPRERFSLTQRSLESLFAHTTQPFALIYVDAGSPRKVRSYLETEAARKRFQLVRVDRYLTQNQSRNLAIQEVRTKYVVFADNDVLFAPGWLDELVRCAEETGAWVVGPLYCVGEPAHQIVHMAGGTVHIEEAGGKRYLCQSHRFAERQVTDVWPQLCREPTELVEFHCMLVRLDVFERLGPFDEGVFSTSDHIDFCLSVREAGGIVYLEPKSLVTQVAAGRNPPSAISWSDLPYYTLRWSDAWNEASLQRLREKWSLSEDDPYLATLRASWVVPHRRLAVPAFRKLAHICLGWRGGTWVERRLDDALTRRWRREDRRKPDHVPSTDSVRH
jgi:GT2 family glycosyltransferase